MTAPADISVYWILVGLFASLLTGTPIRFVALRNADNKTRQKRLASLRTWWLLSIVVGAAMLVGRTVGIDDDQFAIRLERGAEVPEKGVGLGDLMIHMDHENAVETVFR